MNELFKYIRPKLKTMGFGFVTKTSGTIFELLLPWMLSIILDDCVPQKDMNRILLWGGGMIICAALALALNVYSNRLACRVSRSITMALRHDLFEKVCSLSSAQVDGFTTPSLISRLTTDTYNVHQMVDRMQRLGVRAPIMLIGGIALTFMLEPVLTLVLVATLPLLAIVIWQVSSRGVRMYTRTQEALDTLVRRAQESMTGIRVIQALSKQEYERGRFETANRETADRDYRASLLMNVTNPVMQLLLNVGLTLVVVVGAYRVNGGYSQPGAIVAFLSYFTLILNALLTVSRMFVMYSKGAASARRIAEVLTAPEDLLLEEYPTTEDEPLIVFDHVSFSYNKREDTVTDISFTLDKGETLGIIGPTGSGKSTLLWLLLRLYDPDSGSIRLGGRDLRSIPAEELHSKFGAVFQNDFLFAGEIAENIRFGRNITDKMMNAGAKTAQADFIAQREGGFTSELAPHGSNLSGGQRQRVLLSRALAGEAEILLLDDSSSALDYKTDAALRRALAKDHADSAKIIVAQRVSSLQNADRILVLEDGRAVGYGSHEELLRTCRSYSEIAKIQMGEVE